MSSLPPDYESKSAAEKLDLLWERVNSDPYDTGQLPTKLPSPWERRKILSVAHNRGSFEHVSDEMVPAREKLIHRHGSCAKVTLRFTKPHPFTGVFASGGPALLRLSDGSGIKPLLLGAAMKFLVDARPSLNLFCSPQGLDKPARGFLSVVLANNLPAREDINVVGKVIGDRFQKAADELGAKRVYFNYLPLHHLAQMNLDGSDVESATVPDRVELHATDAALELAGATGDWRARLDPVVAGTTLWKVHLSPALEEPAEEVGEVVLDSAFVASRYGDDRLFFRHDVGPTT